MTLPGQHILYEYCVPHARKQDAGRRRKEEEQEEPPKHNSAKQAAEATE